MAKRRIAVVTGARAEYGLLRWLMQEIQGDADLELRVLVTGAHLSKRHGETWKAIEADGFSISHKIDIDLGEDSALAVTESLSKAVSGFARVFDKDRPDLIVVLGDRYEILAAATAALVAAIPVAHIHGGELTEGVMDDAIRHSITKMSQLHFVAAEPYKKRVIQLGESPDRVHLVGAVGIENFARLKLLDRAAFETATGYRFGKKNILVTYHPVSSGDHSIDALLQAIPSDANILFTMPNADPGNHHVSEAITAWVKANSGRAFTSTSLGQTNYLSALKLFDIVAGNSSSGIIEAPAAGIPTVNVGPRQRGRIRAGSIVDCGESASEISAAIAKAFAMKPSLKPTQISEMKIAAKIKDVLKKADLKGITRKAFHDL